MLNTTVNPALAGEDDLKLNKINKKGMVLFHLSHPQHGKGQDGNAAHHCYITGQPFPAAPSQITRWPTQLWNCFVMAKIMDKLLRETNDKYKLHLEDIWSPVLQYLETLKLVPPKAVVLFCSNH